MINKFIIWCFLKWGFLQSQRPQFDSWVKKICWRRDKLPTPVFLAFPCVSAGKESTCNVGDLGSISGLGRSPGEWTATNSSIQAWRIPWTEEPDRLQFMGSQRVGYKKFLWKEWCWSWNSSTLATSCEELTHWKRLRSWEGLGAGGEGDDRGSDGWMSSLTRWTWVWVNSGSWWWTGRPGVLQFMGLQRVGHDWVTELNWTEATLTSLHI